MLEGCIAARVPDFIPTAGGGGGGGGVNHYVCALYFVLSQFTLSIVD